MQIGVVYPQTEMPPDVGEIRAYAQGVESMGFSHILAYDHVLGANTASRPGWRGPYDLRTPFQEPLVLFSYLAGVTTRIGFATGVVILPQRQTALVAKQAACVDILCEGRFRLGVGVGWNDVEYEALGMNFHDRGKRCEEQIHVLRKLWTQPAVTHSTRFHTIQDAGINPLPLQRPIPIWMGGGSPGGANRAAAAADRVLARIARMADGWMPLWQPDATGKEWLQKFRGICREIGRDPDTFPIEGRATLDHASESRWPQLIEDWRALGASHVSVVTMRDGLEGADQHLRRLEEFRKAIPAA